MASLTTLARSLGWPLADTDRLAGNERRTMNDSDGESNTASPRSWFDAETKQHRVSYGSSCGEDGHLLPL